MPRIPIEVEVLAEELLDVIELVDPDEDPDDDLDINNGVATATFMSGVVARATATVNVPAQTATIQTASVFAPDGERVLFSPSVGVVVNLDGDILNEDEIEGFDVTFLNAADFVDADDFLDAAGSLQNVFLDLPILENLDGITLDMGTETEGDYFGRADIIEYDIEREDIEVTLNADGSVTMTDPFDTATATGLEVLALEDGAYVYSDLEEAEFVYLLYSGLLQREPDFVGFTFWLDRVENGLPIRILAQRFSEAPEFEEAFGGEPEDLVFIETLYERVLGRASDTDGRDFWLDAFQSGQFTRGDMLQFFTGSDENRERVAEDIDDGFWVQPVDFNF